MATAIPFAIISCIALSAIVIAMSLLRRNGRLRRIAAKRKRLRCRALAQRDVAREEATLRQLREAALIRHARQVIDERDNALAQLVACTEAPRFPVVTRGQA